jgi:hypothetical protein
MQNEKTNPRYKNTFSTKKVVTIVVNGAIVIIINMFCQYIIGETEPAAAGL